MPCDVAQRRRNLRKWKSEVRTCQCVVTVTRQTSKFDRTYKVEKTRRVSLLHKYLSTTLFSVEEQRPQHCLIFNPRIIFNSTPFLLWWTSALTVTLGLSFPFEWSRLGLRICMLDVLSHRLIDTINFIFEYCLRLEIIWKSRTLLDKVLWDGQRGGFSDLTAACRADEVSA